MPSRSSTLPQPSPDERLELLLEALRPAPTSLSLQPFCLLQVSDSAVVNASAAMLPLTSLRSPVPPCCLSWQQKDAEVKPTWEAAPATVKELLKTAKM